MSDAPAPPRHSTASSSTRTHRGLGHDPDAVQTLEATVPGRGEAGYPIRIGPGAWRDLVGQLPPESSGVAVISDERVWSLWGKALESHLATVRHKVYRFPPGDRHKTRVTKEELEDALLADLWGRDAVILALGGGVVSDMAGFVAATYLRGVPYLSLPTTLLGMVDASIGGKTGVNTPAGKNLVGAFHQPRAVLANLTTLGTLPPEQWETGLAESLKHGLMADRELVDLLVGGAGDLAARQPALIADLVVRSASVKVRVVAQDEQDFGVRQILNFGHTIGHALELASGFQLSHGRAVAIGMAVEADAGARAGLVRAPVAEAVRESLEALGLPRKIPPDVSPERILAGLGVDKKVRAGKVRFALPDEVGVAAPFDGQYTTPLPERAVQEALQEALREAAP